jgi:hypothetical protein
MSIEADLKKFLSEQERASTSFTATIEPVTDRPDSVRITPVDSGGCGCDRAIIVAVSHIESIEAVAGESRECCGKRLNVARVKLKAEATVQVSDLVSTRSQHARETNVRPDRPGNAQECWHQELRCIASGTPYGLCHAYYEDCLERNWGPDDSRAATNRGGTWADCHYGCVQAFAECRNSGQSKGACAQRFEQCTRRCHY